MLTVAKGANAALMFFLELGALGSVVYWGFTVSPNWVLKIVAGLGVPVVMAVLWALFAAGGGANATFPLHGIVRALFEIAWFGGAALALYSAAALTPALIFATVYVVNAVLRLIWNQV
ncbi:YrdB family protein [Nocardia sp. alder85J]|uniref:YrdB family protein n=1 Tax=Nocardia sp. alder85J TaxID=2862949 RepID=UPI001CD32BCE|nr:YrdB family protein [Nocardia sp. alder85J]MCX4097825.1 YrdB family protein [Nocardia sp. alder85J]